jgi:hypothetical protein
MKIQNLTAITLFLMPLLSNASELSVPHSFQPETIIKSSEMNANFIAITDQVNTNTTNLTEVTGNLSELKATLDKLEQSTTDNGSKLSDISITLSAINDSLASIDTKLTTTSPASVSDQLICRGQPRNLATETMLCLQASDSGTTKNLTMAQIFSDGWIAISLGGPDDFYAGYIFQK